jgi:hypothetical protein
VFYCAEPYPPSNVTAVAGIREITVDVFPSKLPNTSVTSCTLQVYSSDGSQLIFQEIKPTNGSTIPIQFYVVDDELTPSTKYELRAYMDWSTLKSDSFTAFVDTQPRGLYYHTFLVVLQIKYDCNLGVTSSSCPLLKCNFKTSFNSNR